MRLIATAGRDRRLLDRYGPTAVITGASSGIGREIALQLAEAGFALVLVARREHLLADVATRVGNRVPVHVLPLDLTRPAAVENLATATADTDVGLCVAAAGFGTSGPFLGSDLQREEEMLRVNCAALLAQAHLFGNRFAARGRGGLVLMSSIVGFQGAPFAAHYAATKAYVQTLAEGLHAELGPRGVDVLAAAPGPVHSGFAERADMTMGRAMSARAAARGTLKALGRRPTAVPGLRSRLLKDSLAPLPRRVRVRVMGTVMAGLANGTRTS